VAYSAAVDSALVAKLLADTGPSGLLTLMSDGVWWDVAPQGKTKVVIVRLMAHSTTPMQGGGGRAYETPIYLVKAVALGTTGADVKAAGARIDVLLDGGTLTVPGYSLMAMRLDEYVHYVETDPTNADARWHHYGGMYEIYVSPG
jgi:hypothetical protein